MANKKTNERTTKGRFNLKEQQRIVEQAKKSVPKANIVACSRCAVVAFQTIPNDEDYFISATS